jgi:hypothetical protein
MAHSTWTEKDFDRLSWHDNHVYAIVFCVGDISLGDWRSDLVLDIDHIVEWVCGSDRRPQFLVAPATLAFHDVTDLRLDLAWPTSGFRVALNEVSIAGMARAPIADQEICLDRPYYSWRIETNLPPQGLIAFGASGFTQKLRAAPVLIDEQKLSPAGRATFHSGG